MTRRQPNKLSFPFDYVHLFYFHLTRHKIYIHIERIIIEIAGNIRRVYLLQKKERKKYFRFV